jgi:hypothetical protein
VALRLLSDELSKLEKRHQERIERGDNPAEVDRQTAQSALNGVLAFFQDYDIEAKPLVRLLSALAALTAGASLPAMLTPVSMRHHRPDPPTVEIKGRLAAVMEFRQETGLSRKAASEWVARNLPSKVKRELGSISPATVCGCPDRDNFSRRHWLQCACGRNSAFRAAWSAPSGLGRGHFATGQQPVTDMLMAAR